MIASPSSSPVDEAAGGGFGGEVGGVEGADGLVEDEVAEGDGGDDEARAYEEGAGADALGEEAAEGDGYGLDAPGDGAAGGEDAPTFGVGRVGHPDCLAGDVDQRTESAYHEADAQGEGHPGGE